jgi:hypothetical protein
MELSTLKHLTDSTLLLLLRLLLTLTKARR